MYARSEDLPHSDEEEDDGGISFLKEQQWQIEFATVPVVEQPMAASVPALGEILARFRAQWKNCVAVVVSDHDHEAVDAGAVDLKAEVEARGLDLKVDHEGTAALLVGEVAESEILDLPGVSQSLLLAPGFTLAWGPPGQQFGTDWGLASQHGSPRTRRQLAVVGGGHPAAAGIAREIRAIPPQAVSWAGRVRELLALPPLGATG